LPLTQAGAVSGRVPAGHGPESDRSGSGGRAQHVREAVVQAYSKARPGIDPDSKKNAMSAKTLRWLEQVATEISTAPLRLVITHDYGYYGLERWLRLACRDKGRS
jgi:hypothetical protein